MYFEEHESFLAFGNNDRHDNLSNTLQISTKMHFILVWFFKFVNQFRSSLYLFIYYVVCVNYFQEYYSVDVLALRNPVTLIMSMFVCVFNKYVYSAPTIAVLAKARSAPDCTYLLGCFLHVKNGWGLKVSLPNTCNGRLIQILRNPSCSSQNDIYLFSGSMNFFIFYSLFGQWHLNWHFIS